MISCLDCKIAGWGRVDDLLDPYPSKLQEANITFVDSKTCAQGTSDKSCQKTQSKIA